MSVNHYFQSGLSIGNSSEQLLMENLIEECIKIYGFDITYIPRQTIKEDEILTEDILNQYTFSYQIEMYLQSSHGFEGQGSLLSKFGMEFRDTATFIVARRRWDDVVAAEGNVQLTTRPAEGDIIYFPLTKAFFEIRRVEAKNPFFQIGNMYVYALECELFQYSSEKFQTNIYEIDNAAKENSFDIKIYSLKTEDGFDILLEYVTQSSLILESYNELYIDEQSQNEAFYNDSEKVLSFDVKNPFGEPLH